MRAKDVLLNALQEFTGTVVFVSHDRYFIDKLATRVFEVEDGRVHVYPGNYEDYLWRKEGGGPEKIVSQIFRHRLQRITASARRQGGSAKRPRSASIPSSCAR